MKKRVEENCRERGGGNKKAMRRRAGDGRGERSGEETGGVMGEGGGTAGLNAALPAGELSVSGSLKMEKIKSGR